MPTLDLTYLALERTSTGSTNKLVVAEKLLPKFIFGSFCEFLNFSFNFLVSFNF
jgi:hypothetical protein